MVTPAEPNLTIRQARAQYFERNQFGADGGYSNKWVRLKAGPISIYFPNTGARVRAVRFHDIHHVLTGYDTSWLGEAEIGAWEVASGCGRHYPAWILNLHAMAIGLFLNPRRVYRAFVRGRRSANLYSCEFSDTLLEKQINSAQVQLYLDRSIPPGSDRDKVLFIAWNVVGLAMLAWPLWLILSAAALWYALA
ncbi:MAG: hypothetical protein L0Z53_02950 [Acidobacteriales bacterium]|nr:hypothetical protein [Terriglobales bacterium]